MGTHDSQSKHNHDNGKGASHAVGGVAPVAAAGSTPAKHVGHGGHDHAAIAAVFMSASTVIVAINGQLLRFYWQDG